jgi:hypothetical protein
LTLTFTITFNLKWPIIQRGATNMAKLFKLWN